MKHTRKRMQQAFCIILVIILGLASRKYGELLPGWLAVYSGDILWGLLVYLIVGFLLPKQRIIHTALIAFVFSTFIEVSQLYHAPWIDEIRSFKLGGLLLGYGFLWSDIICYLTGIAFGAFVEWIYYTKTNI
ncbi:MAG: hypothetical protein A2Y23_04450 [Clostridiales bacterium GWB2_37_7]|nr:MAG: hypothetical protein A2Y23_04450 [Clostridiales bacterium GWB2_37_7]